MRHFRLLATLLAALALAPLAGCEGRGTERWATTENTNVAIDWDRVNAAYKDAEGPEDFERRVNEIYEGDELISVAVTDADDRTQTVTGFFDHNANGVVDEPEKVFTITRKPTGEGSGEYQTAGYGHYYGYTSPMMSIMTGMMMGSMMSNMFAPRYLPVAYNTSPGRLSALSSQRSSYRATNPTRFNRASNTGRTYGGSSGTRSSAPRSRGGTRFGVTSRRRRHALLA